MEVSTVDGAVDAFLNRLEHLVEMGMRLSEARPLAMAFAVARLGGAAEREVWEARLRASLEARRAGTHFTTPATGRLLRPLPSS
jgi:hypothetical protein